MKQPLFLASLGVTLLFVMAAFVSPHLSLFLAFDSCMAAGGSFDFAQVSCDFQQSHAYVVFDLWPFQLALAGSCLGVLLAWRGLLGCGASGFRLRMRSA